GDPFLVILDEPNANLDRDGELALVKAIELLRQRGAIVVLVSHRPDAIAALNIAMVLYEGRMIAFGPREEVFARVAQAAQQVPTVQAVQAAAGQTLPPAATAADPRVLRAPDHHH